MPTITPDPISLTTHHLHLCFRETDRVLSSATGFVYERSNTPYLITNWHNVTGRNPATGECLSETLAVPDMVSTLFRTSDQPASCLREHLPLYSDSSLQKPVWYEHPKHGRSVDVVAVPLPTKLQSKYRLFPINKVEFDSQFKEKVADDAFVIGYPFSEITYLQLPVWKRASIATEPDVNLNQLPKFLVDTATRPGLSGSPVVMQRVGIHGMKGGTLTGQEIFGTIRKFVGIYSGRLGADEAKAQLGIVWKATVIDEIIDGHSLGQATSA